MAKNKSNQYRNINLEKQNAIFFEIYKIKTIFLIKRQINDHFIAKIYLYKVYISLFLKKRQFAQGFIVEAKHNTLILQNISCNQA